MKAYQLEGGFGFDNLKLKERPLQEPGPYEILIKMRAWSLNFRDLMVVKGIYNPKMRLPMVPLSDGVGEVAAVGPKVTRVKTGDRVAGIFMQKWLSGEISELAGKSALGGGIDGLLAEYVTLHEDGVVPLPTHLSDEEGATLPCAGVTAWNALVSQGRLKAGDTVLIEGTGGVSLFALQFARLHGARVIATTGSDHKIERLRQLGAEAVINYKTNKNWGDQVSESSQGQGVDHIVEVGGAGNMPQSLRAVRMGGQIAMIGVLAGGEFNPLPVLMKHIRIQGVYVGSREMFEAMNKAIASRQMRPIIDRVFSFDEFVPALKYMESGAHFGKIVIKA